MSDPNILLVILDSVRAKNTGVYGYHRDTTPFLQRYSDEATVYRQARAPGIHSVASHASIWTGAEVQQHRVVNHEDQLRPDTTIWEELSEAGYRSAIFTTNPIVAHSSNLSEQFDDRFTDTLTDTSQRLFKDAHSPDDVGKHEGVVGNLTRCLDDDQPVRSLLNSVHHMYLKKRRKVVDESLTSADLVEQFLEWQDDSTGPWAACLNLMDAHFPYTPDADCDHWGGDRLNELHADLTKPPANEFIGGRPWWQLEAFEHLYDGTIRELDGYVQRIVQGLKQTGDHEDTLVVVTSDHGEGFGEMSRLTGRTRLVDHSWGIHEVITHVPLVVKYPGQTKGTVVEEFASLSNFPETVRSVTEGKDTRRTFVPDGPVVSSTDRVRNAQSAIFEDSEEDIENYLGPWRAVYREEDGEKYKYLERDGESLVVRIQDAQNSYPVRRDVGDTVQRAFDSFETRGIKIDSEEALSDTVEEQLEELGYLR